MTRKTLASDTSEHSQLGVLEEGFHFLHTSSEFMSDSDMAFQISVFSQTHDRGLQSHFVLTWLMPPSCALNRI